MRNLTKFLFLAFGIALAACLSAGAAWAATYDAIVLQQPVLELRNDNEIIVGGVISHDLSEADLIPGVAANTIIQTLNIYYTDGTAFHLGGVERDRAIAARIRLTNTYELRRGGITGVPANPPADGVFGLSGISPPLTHFSDILPPAAATVLGENIVSPRFTLSGTLLNLPAWAPSSGRRIGIWTGSGTLHNLQVNVNRIETALGNFTGGSGPAAAANQRTMLVGSAHGLITDNLPPVLEPLRVSLTFEDAFNRPWRWLFPSLTITPVTNWGITARAVPGSGASPHLSYVNIEFSGTPTSTEPAEFVISGTVVESTGIGHVERLRNVSRLIRLPGAVDPRITLTPYDRVNIVDNNAQQFIVRTEHPNHGYSFSANLNNHNLYAAGSHPLFASGSNTAIWHDRIITRSLQDSRTVVYTIARNSAVPEIGNASTIFYAGGTIQLGMNEHKYFTGPVTFAIGAGGDVTPGIHLFPATATFTVGTNSLQEITITPTPAGARMTNISLTPSTSTIPGLTYFINTEATPPTLMISGAPAAMGSQAVTVSAVVNGVQVARNIVINATDGIATPPNMTFYPASVTEALGNSVDRFVTISRTPVHATMAELTISEPGPSLGLTYGIVGSAMQITGTANRVGRQIVTVSTTINGIPVSRNIVVSVTGDGEILHGRRSSGGCNALGLASLALLLVLPMILPRGRKG